MKGVLLCLLLLAGLAPHGEAVLHLRPEWNALFEQAGTHGTFVLLDLGSGLLQTNDSNRAATRFLPASTFKIPNALIALETGVAQDERQIFVWDGVEREITSWNRNHTLKSAMSHSVVPIFQDLARQVGVERMQEGLDRLGYGNANCGGGIDQFWLDGDLRISPFEQVDFLGRLYRRELPFSERSQRIVHELLLAEAASKHVLRVKTGYAIRATPAVGWWVGWLELEDRSCVFALNMDMPTGSFIPERGRIGRAILKAEGLLP